MVSARLVRCRKDMTHSGTMIVKAAPTNKPIPTTEMTFRRLPKHRHQSLSLRNERYPRREIGEETFRLLETDEPSLCIP